MAKIKGVDPITAGIVAVTLIAIVYLMIQAGIIGSKQPKIAILETAPLVEAINSDAAGADVLEMRKQIEVRSEVLAEQGYIVLRTEMVRAAPKELYVPVNQQ